MAHSDPDPLPSTLSTTPIDPFTIDPDAFDEDWDDLPDPNRPEVEDTLPGRLAGAYLGTLLVDVRDVSAQWGTGLEANRPLQPDHVKRLKAAFQVSVFPPLILNSLTISERYSSLRTKDPFAGRYNNTYLRSHLGRIDPCEHRGGAQRRRARRSVASGRGHQSNPRASEGELVG